VAGTVGIALLQRLQKIQSKALDHITDIQQMTAGMQ